MDNGNLIKKIYLPRELFPVASVWVSAVHFFPQLVGAGRSRASWRGGSRTLFQLAGGGRRIFVMVALPGHRASGLLFGAANVYFRDSENIVDMILMVVTWASPVLYSWTMVAAKLGAVVLRDLPGQPDHGRRRVLPLGLLVTDAQRTVARRDAAGPVQPLAAGRLVISLVVLFLGQLTFRRLDVHFAQELYMTAHGDVAISCTDISKQFVLRHTRSLKEAVVWLVKGRKGDLSKKFHRPQGRLA